MATLKIQCFLDENQMLALTDLVTKHLYDSDRTDLEDIDLCIDTLALRLCVEFNIGLDNIELKQAEILDCDWNLVDADSAVLRSRLKTIIKDYNTSDKELTMNHKIMRQERIHELCNS